MIVGGVPYFQNDGSAGSLSAEHTAKQNTTFTKRVADPWIDDCNENRTKATPVRFIEAVFTQKLSDSLYIKRLNVVFCH